jgi:PAS domain S-box-containing protein
VWGVLALHDCDRPREWTGPELEALRIAADMLGAALVRDRIRGDLVRAQRQASETTMLLEALQETAPVAFGFVDYDLLLVRCNRQLAAISGQPVDLVLGRPVPSVLAHVWPQLETGFRTALNARATVDNVEVTGTMPDDLEREQVWLATFYPVRLYGDVIGVGLMMVDITERREAERARDKLTRDAIGAIAAAVEARDPYTAGHQRRVGQIAELIAMEMGLEPSVIEGIKLAGEIHDIGKVAVPAEILARPGALRAPEYELVKIHARAGAEIVAGITFPWPIAEMIGQHHEHYDGSGYPDGLRGEQILTGSHIIHVADVVEAMSSHRPYRPSKGIEDALDTIRDGAGTEFEPSAAAACLRLAADGHFPLLAPDPVTTGPWQPEPVGSPASP